MAGGGGGGGSGVIDFFSFAMKCMFMLELAQVSTDLSLDLVPASGFLKNSSQLS